MLDTLEPSLLEIRIVLNKMISLNPDLFSAYNSHLRQALLVRAFLFLLVFPVVCDGQDAAQSIPETPPLTAESPQSSKEVPNLRLKQKELLSGELDGTSMVELNAAGEQFIALWEPDRSGSPIGALLIAHGEGQTADWPNTLHPLRTNIVTHGWATLSISLPNPQGPHVPKRQVEGEKAETPIEPVSDNNSVEDIAQKRLMVGFEYLHQQGQYNIVIVGHGVSATRALHFTKVLTEESSGAEKSQTRVKKTKVLIQRPIRAAILLNARNKIAHTPSFTSNLPELLEMGSLPTLDLYFDDHYQDFTEADLRLKSARLNHIEHYYQVKLMEPTSEIFEGENRMTRRVRGFLNKHAKGVEIK